MTDAPVPGSGTGRLRVADLNSAIVSTIVRHFVGVRLRCSTQHRPARRATAAEPAAPVPDPTPAERLRQQLMAVLSDTRQSKSTAQLRDDVRERFGDPVVIEAVYRNLTVLERRGDVRRSKSSGRDTHWLAASEHIG
ncbi:hypothetical protein MSMEI_0418 [Mycolicibacterium smegmatis MC2 155]|uniref:Ferric uptake regulator n=2 Tax=Mycolicibacterium smegmatis TaxID=1772 RepID=I7G378_MYCS2|nr:hypothetical protein MSMEI_0418 [Mycolicibacterium smegmatis MC2 155]